MVLVLWKSSELDARPLGPRLGDDAVNVIDLAAEKRRRQGFKVLEPDAISLTVFDNLDGRGLLRLTVEGEDEELLLAPETLRAWARKMLTVADQIDAPAPRLALVAEEA